MAVVLSLVPDEQSKWCHGAKVFKLQAHVKVKEEQQIRQGPSPNAAAGFETVLVPKVVTLAVLEIDGPESDDPPEVQEGYRQLGDLFGASAITLSVGQ